MEAGKQTFSPEDPGTRLLLGTATQTCSRVDVSTLNLECRPADLAVAGADESTPSVRSCRPWFRREVEDLFRVVHLIEHLVNNPLPLD